MADTLWCAHCRTVLGSAMKRTESGFTLVELAVVLVIIGTMLTLGLAAFNAQMTTGGYAKTRAKIETIKNALIDHLGRHMYLPCPDRDFGPPFDESHLPDGSGEDTRTTANDPTTHCTAYVGILPYRDLGLSRDDALDGWGNYFTYHVSDNSGTDPLNSWTTRGTPSSPAVRPASTGSLVLQDAATGGTVIANQLVVVVVSHGKNGLAAYTVKGVQNSLPDAGSSPDERENTDADLTYVQRDYSEKVGGGGPFDDVVSGFTNAQLLGPLILSGALPSVQAEMQQRFDDAEAAVLAQVLTNCQVPTPITGFNDPWGNAIQIDIGEDGTTVSHTAPSLTPKYTLKSGGPDGNVTTSSDNFTRTRFEASLLLRVPDSMCPPPPPP